MKQVSKIYIGTDKEEVVSIPVDFLVLKLEVLGMSPNLWVLHSVDAPMTEIKLVTFNDGEPFDDSVGKYLGTYYTQGLYSKHVFIK